MSIEGDRLGKVALKVKRWPKDTIAAGRRHTVGLKSDSMVTAVGWNKHGHAMLTTGAASNFPATSFQINILQEPLFVSKWYI